MINDLNLEKRIAAALTEDVTSTELAAVIANTEAAITEADATAKAEKEKALDLLVSPDADKARAAMEDAAFICGRLRAALPRLQARLNEVRSEEELARWLPQREAAKAYVDELAAKLGELYRPFVHAIVPLLLEIEEADHEVWRVNQAMPDKAKSAGRYLLHSVEHEARGHSADQLRHLQIMKDLQLPNWEGSELPVWPPHRPRNLAVVAPLLGGDPRLFSNRWWEPKQEQAGAAAERAALEEKEREAKALENHHGVRWWERGRT